MDPMLEQETHIIIQTLTDRAIGSAQSLALKDALSADLPKSIKLYLQCEVTRWLQHDLNNANHFANVRLGSPSVRQLTRTFMRALASEYVFTREEFSNTIENAVHFVQNYLCRPHWMLEQFIFESNPRVTITNLREKFEYFSDYLYFGKLVVGYMQQKGWQEIGVAEFRSLLSKCDEQIVKQHAPRELAQLARPIFEYLLLQREVENATIPLKPLLVFFEDKNMLALKEYIERICHIRNTETLTLNQLAEIIEDMRDGSSVFVRDSASREPVRQSHEQGAGQAAGPNAADEQPPRSIEEIPFHDSTTVEPEPEAAPPQKPLPLSDSPQRGDRRNIALSLTFSGMTETGTESPTPLPDFRTTISSEQRERFIRAVFQRDEAYYNVVMESLNAMTTWRDASLYLQTFYQTTGVDPSSQDVIEFTDLIQSRYAAGQS